jgi:hypothetical protein
VFNCVHSAIVLLVATRSAECPRKIGVAITEEREMGDVRTLVSGEGICMWGMPFLKFHVKTIR